MRSAVEERDEIAVAWAIRLSEDQLDEREQADLRAWLDSDRANGQALEEVAGTWRAVEGYATAVPMMALREEALASARQTSQRIQRARRPVLFHWRRIAAIAATVLLCVIGAGYWIAERPDTYSTARGERRVVMLDDGSRLSLDASTAVRVKYSDGRRRIWLDGGRAKFDVAPDPLRPFSVSAEDRVVVATGTSFSVELADRQVRIALYEGHISVLREGVAERNRNATRPAAAVASGIRMEQPGRELVLDEARGAVGNALLPIDPVRSTSWQAGMLDFENDPLELVVARTNRSAEMPLVLGDPEVGRLRVSGIFRAGDSKALVEGLEMTLGIRAERRADEIVLYASPAGKPGK